MEYILATLIHSRVQNPTHIGTQTLYFVCSINIVPKRIMCWLISCWVAVSTLQIELHLSKFQINSVGKSLHDTYFSRAGRSHFKDME